MNWINEAYGEIYSVAMGNIVRHAPQTEWEIERNLGEPQRHNRGGITRFAATTCSRLATALQKAATALHRPPSTLPGTFSHLADGRSR